ncbi:MAG: bile acid:sodium symporter family protein [Marinifilaceae bacterium]
MNQLIIVIPILTLMMFLIGLELKTADIKIAFKSPAALIIGLLGQLVLLPIIALLIAMLFNMPTTFFIGFMLIACCPGGSSSNVLTYLAKGDVALSVVLTTMSSVITLITLPLYMSYILYKTEFVSDNTVDFPIKMMVIQNIVLILLPICIGMLIQYYKKNWAHKCAQFIQKGITPALLLMIFLFCVEHHITIARYFKQLGMSSLLLLSSTLFVGLLLARWYNLHIAQRKTITIEIGIQNAAQAIALACSPLVFNNTEMAIPAIVYAIIMNGIILGYVFIPNLLQRKARV